MKLVLPDKRCHTQPAPNCLRPIALGKRHEPKRTAACDARLAAAGYHAAAKLKRSVGYADPRQYRNKKEKPPAALVWCPCMDTSTTPVRSMSGTAARRSMGTIVRVIAPCLARSLGGTKGRGD